MAMEGELVEASESKEFHNGFCEAARRAPLASASRA